MRVNTLYGGRGAGTTRGLTGGNLMMVCTAAARGAARPLTGKPAQDQMFDQTLNTTCLGNLTKT